MTTFLLLMLPSELQWLGRHVFAVLKLHLLTIPRTLLPLLIILELLTDAHCTTR